MRISTVFPHAIFTAVKEYVIRHKPKESFVLVGCGLSSSGQHTRLLAIKPFLPAPEDYEVQEPYAVRVKEEWFRTVLSTCATEQLHPLFVHSHPFETGHPKESPIDKSTAKQRCIEISAALNGSLIANMVVNSDLSAFEGHIYDRPRDRRIAIDKILVPEQGHLRWFRPTSSLDSRAGVQRVDYRDYNSRLSWGFGDAVAEMFPQFHFAVIGAGGLGEDLAVQLATLGPELTIIDTDVFQNVNEIRSRFGNETHSSKYMPKVALARLACLQSRPNTVVHTIRGDIRDEVIQKEVIKADAIVVGTDNVTSRIVASRLAMTHGMLLFDVGTGITVEDGRLVSVRGQVMKLMPGLNLCHECAQFMDVNKGYDGLLNEQDYEFRRRQGYIKEVKAPQVMPVNSVMAGTCMWEILRYFSGASRDHHSDVVTLDLLNNTSQAHLYERRADGTRTDCPVCARGDFLTGDRAPFLCRHRESATDGFLRTMHKGKAIHGTADTSKHRQGSTPALATR